MQLPKTLLRSVLPILQPHIPAALTAVDALLQQHLASLPLKDNEVRATLLLMRGTDGRIFLTEAFFDSHDHLVRTAHTTPAKSYLEGLIRQCLA